MLNLKYFFGLVKAKQKPYEDALIASMQEKVNWIRKTSTYDLNQRQKDSLERDKALVVTTENYIAIQQQIIAHLFQMLEQEQAHTAAHLADKLEAEQTLRNFIKQNHEGQVHSAA